MLEQACPADWIPHQYQYSHIAFPDRIICMLAEFFKVMFSPQHSSYTTHFLTGFSAEVSIFLIEGSRSDRSWLSNPPIIGMVYQILGAGSLIPLSLLIVILGSKGRARQPLTQAQAESILLAIILGYLLPTLIMFITLDTKITMLWQCFPVWQFLMQRLYLSIRTKKNGSGFHILKLALYATIVSSMLIHFTILHSSPVLRAPISALINWWPSWYLPDPRLATIESTAYHLIKWDSILSYSACVLAACSFAETWSDVITILGIAPICSALFSPGAFISSLWIYREWQLNQKAGLERGHERQGKGA